MQIMTYYMQLILIRVLMLLLVGPNTNQSNYGMEVMGL